MQIMIDWIEEHVTENPSLLDMSKQIGYSPYYCSTQFHAIVGLPFRTYVAQRRLYQATLEIQNSKRSILDIALDCGYSSHEALTRAFTKAYDASPYVYRKNPFPICLPMKQIVFHPEQYRKGELSMTKASIRVEYIPAHKYIGIYQMVTTKDGNLWAGHDCDLVTEIVQNMEHLCDAIVTAHTAGWAWKDGSKRYFYGLGVPLDFKGEIPEGFEIREVPASYYLVFSHPPFEYLKENVEVMRLVEDLAWNYDPKTMGYAWNETDCQDYQRHYPEGLGYQVLRPVVKV